MIITRSKRRFSFDVFTNFQTMIRDYYIQTCVNFDLVETIYVFFDEKQKISIFNRK